MYKNGIRDFAWKIILENDVKELPINPEDLAKSCGVTCRWFRQLGISSPGRALLLTREGLPIIGYNHHIRDPGPMRFAVMHELSHYLLRHISDKIPSNSRLSALITGKLDNSRIRGIFSILLVN